MLAESIEENASMLELEFCYALSFRKKSILFFLLKDVYQKREDATGLRLKRLVSLIKKSGYDYRESADYGDIQHETLQWIRGISGAGASGESPSMLNAYAVRKTRYYVEDKQIRKVYKYLEGDNTQNLMYLWENRHRQNCDDVASVSGTLCGGETGRKSTDRKQQGFPGEKGIYAGIYLCFCLRADCHCQI